jgi:hypothetical protein
MIEQNTRESALRRDAFHRVLQAWLDDTFDVAIGDPDAHAGPAWLWVRHGGHHYWLHAASTREGVREYMHLVRASGGDPIWSTVRAPAAHHGRAAFGPDRRVIEGFELVKDSSRR